MPTWHVPRRSETRLGIVLVACLAMAASAGCTRSNHPVQPAITAPDRTPPASANTDARTGPAHTLPYRETLPDCERLQALLPTSVISVHGSLGVAGKSDDSAPWEAVSCQYLDGSVTAAVTIDRPRTDPVDGQPAAAAVAAHPIALLITRARCTAMPTPTQAEQDRAVRCTTASPRPSGGSSPTQLVAFVAGSGTDLRTLMVAVAFDSPTQEPAHVQRLADLLYRAILDGL